MKTSKYIFLIILLIIIGSFPLINLVLHVTQNFQRLYGIGIIVSFVLLIIYIIITYKSMRKYENNRLKSRIINSEFQKIDKVLTKKDLYIKMWEVGYGNSPKDDHKWVKVIDDRTDGGKEYIYMFIFDEKEPIEEYFQKLSTMSLIDLYAEKGNSFIFIKEFTSDIEKRIKEYVLMDKRINMWNKTKYIPVLITSDAIYYLKHFISSDALKIIGG